MQCLGLINPSAGSIASEDLGAFIARGSQIVREHGWDVRWRVLHPGDCPDRVASMLEEAHYDVAIIAGGDGTLAAASHALSGRRKSLIVMPAGTANLLAADLNLPTDPFEALAASLTGELRHIDIAYANGRAFLNSAVFGVFAELAQLREQARALSGVATLEVVPEALAQLGDTQPQSISLRTHSGTTTYETSLLAIAHNRYTHAVGLRPRRRHLDEGVLQLYAARAESATAFIAALANGLLNGFEENARFQTRTFTRGTLLTPHEMSYTLDGETHISPGAVHFELEPRALRVFAPQPAA